MDIYAKKEDKIVYKYINFLSKDYLEYKLEYQEVFSKESLTEYDNKYTMENYKGHITVKIYKTTYQLYYKDILLIGSGPKNIHSLRYMSLINFTQDDYIYSDILNKEFNNFQKHIMGSSDELLSQILQSWKI